MSLNRIKFVVVFILLAGSVFVVLSQRKAHALTSTFTPRIPRVWDDAKMAGLQLPLIDSTASPRQISSDYYYRIPVNEFEVPGDPRQRYDILWSSVGTDPRLALETRRGTGYYKVPSLKGVWYRGPFEHNGSVMTTGSIHAG
jgi:hypothetical protein